MIGTHQTLLYVCLGEPRLHFYATKYVVDTGAEVPRSSIDPLFPVCIHALAVGMELATEVPEDRTLSARITLAGNLAVLEELVEDAPVGSIQVVIPRQPFLSYCLLRPSGINLLAGHVQVAGQDHPFAHLCEITNADVEGAKEAMTELVSEAVAVGGTVDAKQHKGRELEDQTASFGVESGWIDGQGVDLGRREVTADGCVFGQIAVCRR